LDRDATNLLYSLCCALASSSRPLNYSTWAFNRPIWSSSYLGRRVWYCSASCTLWLRKSRSLLIVFMYWSFCRQTYR